MHSRERVTLAMIDRLFRRRKLEVPQTAELAQGRDFGRGDLLDQRYQVLDIRQGAMGVVYLAMDRTIEQRVAIKSFQSRFLWNEQALTFFADEARLWIRLGSHPNIVQAFALCEFSGRPHVVAEFVDGYTLRALVGGVTPAQVLDIGIQVCWGMSYAHERGLIVHRDLKPDNVMITRHGVPKVTDFGLARALPAYLWIQQAVGEVPKTLASSGSGETFGGTPPYMAPELFRGTFTIGPWIDIYACGVMLFELLTASLPLDAPNGDWAAAHRGGYDPDPRRLRPDLHRGFSHILKRCLEREPLKRYQSFGEIEADLQLLRKHVLGARLEPAFYDRNPDARADQLHSQGVAHLSLGERREALSCFRQANQLRPENAGLWLDTAQTALLLWQGEVALDACNRGLALRPEPNLAARLQRVRGQALVHLHRRPDALVAFDQSLKLNSVDAQTHLARGELLAVLGCPDDALRAFEAATRYDRHAPRGWRALSDALAERGQVRQALEALDTALRLDPRDASGWRRRGEWLHRLKRYQEAAEAFELAIRLDPEDALAEKGLRATRQAVQR